MLYSPLHIYSCMPSALLGCSGSPSRCYEHLPSFIMIRNSTSQEFTGRCWGHLIEMFRPNPGYSSMRKDNVTKPAEIVDRRWGEERKDSNTDNNASVSFQLTKWMLGLRMEDETIRVAVGLRLGIPLCRPHKCSHCGATVDDLATHGLSCRWSEGRAPATQQSMTSRTGHCPQLKYHHDWNLLVFTGLTESTMMGVPFCPGNAERCSYGTSCAQTPSHPRSFHLLWGRLEWWLPRQNNWRMPSTPILTPATISCRSWWRLRGSWERQQRTSYGIWADSSTGQLENPVAETISCRESQLRYKGGMRQRCWERQGPGGTREAGDPF